MKKIFQLCGQDAIDRPFGAMVHMDWIELDSSSPAAKVVPRFLLLIDDQTVFMGGSPSKSKSHKSVISITHAYDDDIPAVRRWWSDRASEFIKASQCIREIRPLAHYFSIPRRHTGNKAERYIQRLRQLTCLFDTIRVYRHLVGGCSTILVGHV